MLLRAEGGGEVCVPEPCVTWSVVCVNSPLPPPHPPSLGCRVLQTGMVYAVEFSHRSGRDLINMAKNRTNIIPIIEDARHPLK